LPGIIVLDVLLAIQRDYKLRSYSLNSVSGIFLNEQKEDVHHSKITGMWKGNDDDRLRLATYCLQDAYLAHRLLEKLMFFTNYIEQVRVTGIPMDMLLTKGQQVKVLSQIYRQCAQSKDSNENYKVITMIKDNNQVRFPYMFVP
jgi:DNA polymerase delta subunit 1